MEKVQKRTRSTMKCTGHGYIFTKVFPTKYSVAKPKYLVWFSVKILVFFKIPGPIIIGDMSRATRHDMSSIDMTRFCHAKDNGRSDER